MAHKLRLAAPELGWALCGLESAKVFWLQAARLGTCFGSGAGQYCKLVRDFQCSSCFVVLRLDERRSRRETQVAEQEDGPNKLAGRKQICCTGKALSPA